MLRFCLSLVFACFRAVPEGLSIRIGLLIGWLARVVLRFRRRVVRTNLDVVFGTDQAPAERAALERGFYRHLGLLLMELLRLPGCDLDRLRRRVIIHGQEHLEAAVARGKGTLVLSGHFGNWELAMLGMMTQGYTLLTLGKRMKTRVGDEIRHLIRDANGVRSIAVKDSTREILRTLRANGHVIFPIDQNRIASEGVFVPFCGTLASTMPGLAVLARRTGAAVVPVFAHRDADLRTTHITAHPPLEFEEIAADADANVAHNTARYNAAVEAALHAHPEQWLWIHKRWKSRPPDESPRRVRY